MTLTFTDRGTHQTTAGTTTNTKTSSSLSPATGSMYVVATFMNAQSSATGNATGTVTDTSLGLTWTRQAFVEKTPNTTSGFYREQLAIWTSSAVSGTPTGTITFTNSQTMTDGWIGFHVWEVAGGFGIGGKGEPTPSLSVASMQFDLGATPAADSTVITAALADNRVDTLVQPTSYTLDDSVNGGAWTSTAAFAHIGSSGAQTGTWTGFTNAADNRVGAIALEVLPLPPFEVLTRRGIPGVISSASATNSAAPTTGVTVNKPASVKNRDVLYAFVSKTNYANTAQFTCSGWTEVSSGTRGTTTGNDRHTCVLRKVITDAGSEPSTYTFVTTSSTTSTMCATIVNVRGADLTNPEDIAVGAPTFASNDSTPLSRDATSVTENALVLNYCQLSLATVALRTWGVPSGYTGNAGNADCGLAANNLNNQQGVAWKTLGAAGSTAGTNVWTHTADEATAENSTVVVLVRPANVSLSPPKPTRRSVRSLLMR